MAFEKELELAKTQTSDPQSQEPVQEPKAQGKPKRSFLSLKGWNSVSLPINGILATGLKMFKSSIAKLDFF